MPKIVMWSMMAGIGKVEKEPSVIQATKQKLEKMKGVEKC